MAERNKEGSNRNRRSSVNEWRYNIPEESREPETSSENRIRWRWEELNEQNRGQAIEEKANDRTLAEWISITENKELFRTPHGEDSNAENVEDDKNPTSSTSFYRRKDNDDENNSGAGVGSGESGSRNRIGKITAYVSGTSSSSNTGSGNTNSRNTSNSNNRSCNNDSDIICNNENINSNLSANITEDSITEALEENTEVLFDINDCELKQESKTLYDWLKKTKNPDLYKKQNDEEDDEKYKQLIQCIDLESAGTHIWEKFYAQTALASELDLQTTSRKRKKAYSLFNSGSDYDEFATPKKKNAYSLHPGLHEPETDSAIFGKVDMNQTPRIFEIRKNETSYSEIFRENRKQNRESFGINRSTDSFVSDSSVTPVKPMKYYDEKNGALPDGEAQNFFNLHTIYETPKKFLKLKLENDEKNGERTESGRKFIQKKYEDKKKEKREDQPLYRKGRNFLHLQRPFLKNTTKGIASYEQDFLHYTETKSSIDTTSRLKDYYDFQTNSETELTSASPSINEIVH